MVFISFIHFIISLQIYYIFFVLKYCNDFVHLRKVLQKVLQNISDQITSVTGAIKRRIFVEMQPKCHCYCYANLSVPSSAPCLLLLFGITPQEEINWSKVKLDSHFNTLPWPGDWTRIIYPRSALIRLP